ncbi:MAG: tRNA adenosine(34) deaminase TadA [Candidatus Latescibacteria bacterium]|nr:tRNA adenosine(34) deaminase TadA [Candidatus Latescibacterota bacterium]
MTPDADDHERWMRVALDEARLAAKDGDVPVGAVLVRDGLILGRDHNRIERTHDPTAHAEMLAIRAASAMVGYERLTGTTLYVTLEPCTMCAGAIVLARIDRLVFGAHDPKAGACGSLMDIVRDTRLNHRVEVTVGVLADECAALLREFFKGVRASQLP